MAGILWLEELLKVTTVQEIKVFMLGSQTRKIEKLNPIAGMEAYKWRKNLFLDLNMTCLSIYINMQVIHFEENQVSQRD